MAEISAGAANWWFAVSNVAVIAGAVGIFYFGRIRDHHTDVKISDNERKAAEAIESNTRLQIDLEKERIQRLLLEQKIEPRKLTDSQRSMLVSKIKSAGWKSVDIIWVGVGEPEFYARDLGSAFSQAGVISKVHTLNPFIPSAWGLLIVETTNDVSKQLKKVLDDIRVDSDFAETNDIIGKRDYPTLVVGQRADVGAPGTDDKKKADPAR